MKYVPNFIVQVIVLSYILFMSPDYFVFFLHYILDFVLPQVISVLRCCTIVHASYMLTIDDVTNCYTRLTTILLFLLLGWCRPSMVIPISK
jgi:hypothetical protein